FVEEELRPEVEAPLAVLRRGVICKHDEFRRVFVLAHVTQQVDARAPRHAHVDDRDVGLVLDQQLEGLHAVFRLAHQLDAVDLAQQVYEALSYDRGIVGNEYFHWAHLQWAKITFHFTSPLSTISDIAVGA